MENNFVVEAVCSSLDMSVEEAQQLMFESEGQGFARLKVNELKNIIRDLKAQGYNKVHLSVTANKPALVDMLRAVAAAEKVNNVPPKVPQMAQATPQGAVPPTHGAQLPPRLAVPPAAAPVASRAANQPQSVLVPGPFSPPPQTHTAQRPNTTNASNTQAHTPHLPTPAPSTASKSKKNKPKPASTHPGHTYIPKPGDEPNLQVRLLTVLTSGHKIQAYKILKEVEGVTENEILTELEGHSNVEALDVDELMFSIVMKRESATPGKPRHPLDALHPIQGVGEGEEGEEEYDALLEQENRDMDAAIRESEKERDVIQQRKRARVEALRQGQDGFLTSGEYQGSVLLFGCPGLCDGGGSGSGGGGGEDKSSGDGGGTTEEALKGGAGSVMAVNGSTNSGGSVVRNTLTKQVLHNALPTTSTTLHRSPTNTSTHSHSTNSDSSASSYAYSSAGGGYNSGSSVGTSSSNRNNSSNIGNTNNKGSNSGNKGGNNSSSSVVDLTLDSESDSEPIVRKAVASSGSSSSCGGGSSNCMVNKMLTNGSSSSSAHNYTANHIPLATTTTITTTITTNTNNTHNIPPYTNPTNNTTELNKKPNMSRSVVVSTFARLLDELHGMQATSGGGSGGGCSIGSSGSSATTTTATTSISTSSGSSSGIQTKPINLYNRVYDITHLSHCSPHCITLLTTLRTSLSRILLLESNASKFYKNTSTAYMVYTARRIDGKLLCDSVDQAINSTFDTITITTSNTSATNTTSTTYADDCIYHLYHHYIRHTALVALLAHESDKLEKGMYKLQTDGSLVPYIFKKPRLAYYARVLAASIDTDGMEVVDVGGGSDSVSGGGVGGGSSSSSSSGSNATLVDTSCTSNTAEPADCCMWASSDESVASEYNSDEDDF